MILKSFQPSLKKCNKRKKWFFFDLFGSFVYKYFFLYNEEQKEGTFFPLRKSRPEPSFYRISDCFFAVRMPFFTIFYFPYHFFINDFPFLYLFEDSLEYFWFDLIWVPILLWNISWHTFLYFTTKLVFICIFSWHFI